MSDVTVVHAPSVVNGELVSVSPTSIEKHERCHRRWYFSKVVNRADPAGPAAKDGTDRHGRLEAYLMGGPLMPLQPVEREMLRFLPPANALGVQYEVPIDKIGLKVEGVPVIGRIDLINDSGIWLDNEGVGHVMEPNEIEVHDHKFTGNLEYAKTPNQLAKTFQMNMYAKAALTLRNVIDRVRISHGYGQTKKKAEALKVTKVITVHEIENYWFNTVVPAVRLMKHSAMQEDFKKVIPNYEACHDFGKPCPFLGECSSDTVSAIIGTPDAQGILNGGHTMSLFSQFNEKMEKVEQADATDVTDHVTEVTESVLPPDAPPSDPVLAKAGAEGQFHKNASGQLYVVKDGQWILAGAKAKADYQGLVEGAKTAGGSPAIAPEPVKRGRGRPRKVEIREPYAKEVTTIETTAPEGASKDEILEEVNPRDSTEVVDIPGEQDIDRSGKILGPTAPVKHSEPQGIQLYVNCIPSIQAMPLEGYIEMLCANIASNTNSPDIRASDHEALKFGKFKGILAAAVRQKPPMPGAYRIMGRSELYDIVVEALAPMCILVVRGVVA